MDTIGTFAGKKAQLANFSARCASSIYVLSIHANSGVIIPVFVTYTLLNLFLRKSCCNKTM
ncbi:hypothetical protein GCM10011351_25820 [Paraliobacillus quinghaiensis]|uniref:Uncharacterized protein n=1 Tax=Paraliobacillus quinghaiensis TaxID=470815 RepID=A0A917TVY0_9BACI|nr:hypothetical protein GCM10011351_25820 [Paraliobacillus quinghaiensis]